MATTVPRLTLFDRVLPDRIVGWLAPLMLAAVLAAVARGRAQWAELPWQVWAHLLLLLVVLALTPVQLWSAKGTPRHRLLGGVWAGALFAAAAVSFGIRQANDGGLSWIHLLSAWVLIQVPWMLWAAHRHEVESHRVRARMLSTFALLVAGFFTFPFGRMLGRWLLG